ncbi:TaqI-like C-terminal specificity domain-containing protein [uncultured Brachyspira sp.]|uniref:Eco57I restriction-modification methylase domain-containing protein n=2 Tax=uncultured Brachyspira sp. TaxID=221953 RepID=UPI0025E5D8B6|nr:TaqI-like C-terminal specificity domain-containing protein [uncultured Brachyspira sp.]
MKVTGNLNNFKSYVNSDLKNQSYEKLYSLIEKFKSNYSQYTNKNYNETETRRDFLDPFFEAFGWDVSNKAGKSQTYRDVVHEDRVKVGKETKAPDYAFRIGGSRVFFAEAKKPGVNLKEDSLPAFQLRRYGWSAKLGISFLTDFEELAVYDCTRKPNVNDKASAARIEYIYFEDYLKRFDFLYEILNKERIEQGSLEKYIAGTSNKKGTESVDIDFLNSLDSLRTKLASNIAKLNKKLSVRNLNYAVQQIIDRIIFLRAAEDRGIEEYGDLKKILENKSRNFYKDLLILFNKADGKYNSGLFDFTKDNITADIDIDNKVIKEIINELYYPLSPYEFSVISVEIIGNAYEQFLGKTITIGKNHSAKIELKPEVRKAGGVYYTPEHIVDYIVANTVGEAVKGKKPEEIANIKILDPACGSGSFLLGAYKYLLNYHIEYYNKIKDRAKFKGSKEDVIKENGDLTIWIKKQILRNNIFGVDIDSNAVEVTKLSLLMKCLEGESPASIQNNQDLFNERALPSLEDNIKCGNSLIGSDFYGSQSLLDFDEETQYKINCFDWEDEFKTVFKYGGFDIVIGNPPYVMMQNLDSRYYFDYCLANYKSAKYKIDTYQIFIEKSIKLLKDNAVISFITPNTFLTNIHSEPLRNYILYNTNILSIVLYKYSVFKDASVDNCVFILSKNKIDNENIIDIKILNSPENIVYQSKIEQNKFYSNDRHNFNILVNENDNMILNKIKENSTLLGNYCGAYFGIQTFDRKKYVVDSKLGEDYKPVIDGGSIFPFFIKDAEEYVHFIDKNIKSGGNKNIYEQDRIVIRQIGETPISAFISAGIYTLNTVYNVYSREENNLNLYFILGIINSKLSKYCWLKRNSDEKKLFPKIKKEAILSIYIPNLDLNNKEDKDIHDKIVVLVDNIIELNKKVNTEKNPNSLNMINRQISACEKQINNLIFSIYNLDDEEKKIVEGN